MRTWRYWKHGTGKWRTEQQGWKTHLSVLLFCRFWIVPHGPHYDASSRAQGWKADERSVQRYDEQHLLGAARLYDYRVRPHLTSAALGGAAAAAATLHTSSSTTDQPGTVCEGCADPRIAWSAVMPQFQGQARGRVWLLHPTQYNLTVITTAVTTQQTLLSNVF